MKRPTSWGSMRPQRRASSRTGALMDGSSACDEVCTCWFPWGLPDVSVSSPTRGSSSLGPSLPATSAGGAPANTWDLTEQIFREVVVITSKPVRPRRGEIGGARYLARVVAPKQLFGTRRAWRGQTPVDVSDPSRTVIEGAPHDPVVGVPGSRRHRLGEREPLDLHRGSRRPPHRAPSAPHQRRPRGLGHRTGRPQP